MGDEAGALAAQGVQPSQGGRAGAGALADSSKARGAGGDALRCQHAVQATRERATCAAGGAEDGGAAGGPAISRQRNARFAPAASNCCYCTTIHCTARSK